jgi:hypothetical protein
MIHSTKNESMTSDTIRTIDHIIIVSTVCLYQYQYQYQYQKCRGGSQNTKDDERRRLFFASQAREDEDVQPLLLYGGKSVIALRRKISPHFTKTPTAPQDDDGDEKAMFLVAVAAAALSFWTIVVRPAVDSTPMLRCCVQSRFSLCMPKRKIK